MDGRRHPELRQDEPDHAQEADTIPEEPLTHAHQDDREPPDGSRHAQGAETIPDQPLRHAQRKGN
jgi:hypothetical protein